MKLETKLGIYAIIIGLLVLSGLFMMMYHFEFYSELNTEDETIIMIIVFATKAMGILILYIASELYCKYFKRKNYEKYD